MKEGRYLLPGLLLLTELLAYTPIGCGSAVLSGPTAPVLGAAECYAIFSTNGAVSNSGITNVTGDIGSNTGSATGYDALSVTGTIHLVPDGSTAQCAADLLTAYNYLNTLPYDIELLYPSQFGNNLVLTPHTYLMNAAATFTDTLYLNAQDNVDAVFVIQVNGALTTSTYSKVILINGAQAKNVYWKVEGSVNINNYSFFCGTIICNNGALGALNTGVMLNGRALTTTGAITTTATNIVASPLPSNCATVSIQPFNAINNNETFTIYPNPFNSFTNIIFNDVTKINIGEADEFIMYDAMGVEVFYTLITNQLTTINTNNLAAGMYFYKVVDNNKIIQSGKIISD